MVLQLSNKDEDTITQFALIMLGVTFLIILYGYIGNYLQHKHIHIIHETGVGIILGFLFGLAAWGLKDINDYQFSQQIFFYGLLPPMIFAGGYNLKKSKFFENFVYISLYGVIGTVVTFGIILGLTFLINYYGLIRDLKDVSIQIKLTTALIVKYSATICASDSVAALTMIKPNKYPKLFSIVFGEGMINDAVAIILFKVVGGIFDLQAHDQSTAILLLTILWKFIVNIVASLAIGTACALLCSKIFQKSRFLANNPIAEVTMIYMFGILSYIIAQIAHMSGVITVLVCGIVLAHFNFYNLSITGQISTGVTFQTISFIAEAFVFIYLGISTMTYATKYSFSYTFIFLQLAICAFARFATIFGLSYFVKIFKKKWKVSFYQLVIISVAGVIRGSVAFALILTLGGGHPDEMTQVVQSSVMVMVFITTICLGGLMPSIIACCLNKDRKNQQILIQPLLEKQNKPKVQKQLKGFKKFDQLFLKPFFIYNYQQRKTQIKQFKKILKLNSPQYKGGQFTGILQANTRQTIIIDPQMANKIEAEQQPFAVSEQNENENEYK